MKTQKDLKEIVSEVQKIISFYRDNKLQEVPGDVVVDSIVKLASYKSSLSDFVNQLDYAADVAEGHYKWTREKAQLQERGNGLTQDDAKAEARIKTEEEYLAWLEAKKAYVAVKLLREDARDMVDALRSKISYMKDNKGQS